MSQFYTTIIHPIRKHFSLSCNDYCVLDTIMRMQNNESHWCYMSKDTMANEHNLIPAQKGEVRNPNGRPKKYVTLLKEQGYKLAEINDTIQAMLSMDLIALCDKEEPKTAWVKLEAENLDDQQKIALWTLLPSKVRSSLKKAKEL